ncbi:pseudouridine synthase family protein [Aspergillus aculeatinus CBS 121060]|uniref:Pseudouridine synthase n=1 Tax=Aspergillus aculeatinus CBS 121060 TaxID=1448322 RepID=A0ACD1H2A3_9EURO|nr:pseudouridine synthase [Aspergillus aculeatinus CBS 121060]RAH67662.1 pseudouridine synthase [Aspergillus aculeatinus CBS 121060]
MAVVPVDTTLQVPPPDPVQEPPEVAVTPCDPWPAPYYFEGGLRRVKPYHYTYNTYCKERWRGRELLDIFLSEFRDRPAEYYKKALETGLVCVNGKPGTPHTVVKNGEIISHTLHRHEPPVTGKEIGIIHEDDDLIVIDKPAGVPVHSAGRYHYNSVLEILRSQRHPDWVPRPCNRLDRLTSGVMFLGKHPKAAEMMCEKLKARTLQKEYVARVKGRFPDGVVVCDQPIMSVSPKVGLNRVRATGKEAKTKFRRLAYIPPSAAAAGSGDGDAAGEVGWPARTGVATPPPIYANEEEGYSIVHCLPLTGRTHQIRVHLQFLGHPISNDPIYSNRKVFGPDLGKNETSDERDQELIARLSNLGKTETVAEAASTSTKPDSSENSYRTHLTAAPLVPPGTDASVVEEIMSREHEAAVERYHKRKGERLSGERCPVCDTELYTDPSPEELGIFLHAAAYADKSGPDGWKYTSQMPSWGLPPVGVDGPRAMPDWVDVPEDEEIVIGYGTVPELGGDGDGDDNPKNHAERRGGGIPALVQGVGLVDISAERQAHEAAAAAAAAAASAETGVGAQATA